jgi:peptidoglycan-N-acetylglucosamine deacetylase
MNLKGYAFTKEAISTLALVFFLIFSISTPILAQNEIQDEPSWMWPEARWRGAVERVRAGQELVPDIWPESGRVAVALSFDFDTETLSLRSSITTPSVLSSGQYGARAGIPRILELLDEYNIKASFFIPAVSAELYSEEVQQIAEAGHEIGVHGWIHEATPTLQRDDELMLMQRSLETLERIGGKRPVGIRTGSWEYSENTLELISELGLLYDSSLMADDKPYELVSSGQRTGIVELPVEWILDDYPYFGMDRTSAIRPHMTPDEVLEIWSSEFDLAYDEGGLFLLTMHPQIIGHRSRIVMLEELIEHIQSNPDVWFATHEEVARASAELIE